MDERLWDSGWKFPVQVDKSTGKIMMSRGEEDIHEAIILIIKTAKKERRKRPGFGSNIHQYAFSEGNLSTLTMLEEDIKSAINNWEPRVSEVDVSASVDNRQQEKIVIDISYNIKSLGRNYKKTIEIDA
ncbi:MAG TPA: GPW/gp25 family protein [Ruminiclostridium sp.]|nr:GPW/gp25 family protein [Ruminiclostridium sp.]